MTSTTLPPPLVVDPTAPHTHTIIFLHRFPFPLPSDLTPRLLSNKRPRDHRTLATQFPSIRWVFPFHKPPPAARPYANLTPADRASIGLEARNTSPYITQLILQEARRLGGLHRVILGGQGDTSEAAHEALLAFPDAFPDALPEWSTELLHLAGFVGMHADAREQTRDVKAYAVTTKMEEGDEPRPGRVGRGVVRNTPHRFIHGGYKVQTQTWDGKRIDEMAKFLEEEMGVHRVPTEEQRKSGKEILTPKDREKKPEVVKETLTEGQKYALELAKNKKANDELAEKIKIRIEADKVERKIRQERERQKRRAAGGAEQADDLTAVPTIKDEPKASTANLTEAQKVALALAKDKKANKALADRTRQRIEEDKIERKIKQERELERRLAAGNASQAPKKEEDKEDDEDDSDQFAESYSDEETWGPNGHLEADTLSPAEAGRLPKRRAKKQAGRVASEGQPWQGGSRARGEMSEAQRRALGLIDEAKAGEEDLMDF